MELAVQAAGQMTPAVWKQRNDAGLSSLSLLLTVDPAHGMVLLILTVWAILPC